MARLGSCLVVQQEGLDTRFNSWYQDLVEPDTVHGFVEML